MLKIVNITKNFKEKQVLKGVTFTVKNGEICGLLGLNGAGKSTLLKIICGLTFAGQGEIYIDDKKNEPGQGALSIGAMIENPPFYDELSGKNNLEYFRTLCPTVPKERIMQVLQMTGMENAMNVPFGKYSLGMKQRLYFACALLKKPTILILDEPFTSIDPVSIALFEDIIKTLAKDGCTIIISGHIISELKNVCTTAVILDGGVIKKSYDDISNIDLGKEFLSIVSGSGDVL